MKKVFRMRESNKENNNMEESGPRKGGEDIFKNTLRASLVAQWLGIGLPMLKTGLIPDSRRFHVPQSN